MRTVTKVLTGTPVDLPGTTRDTKSLHFPKIMSPLIFLYFLIV